MNRSGKILATGDDVSIKLWAADGKTLASGSFDETVKLWEVTSRPGHGK
jgi:WD40 repeat protein